MGSIFHRSTVESESAKFGAALSRTFDDYTRLVAMFFCAISGEVPTEPVVAPSGDVYERRVIEKYLAENGTDPITGAKLELSDLIKVKASEYLLHVCHL